MEEQQQRTTAGSLIEQATNTEPKIAAARQERGSGFEAVAIGGVIVQAWSPITEAEFIIAERAMEAVLDPRTPEAVEQLTEFLARRAILTREAVRDAEVLPLRQQTADAMNKQIARAVAGLNVRNATSACHAIVRKLYDEVAHLEARIEAGIARAFAPGRLLEGIDEAIRAAEPGLATIASALRRLKAQAETEPARIDRDLADSEKALQDAEQQLRIIARESGRAWIFGVDRARHQLIREIQISIPALTAERIAQAYLPIVRTHMPAVERAIGDRAERIEARIGIVRKVHERLRAMRAEEAARLTGRGRVHVVGAPASHAARDAAVDEVVKVAYPSVARELRDRLVWKAAPERILQELRALVHERVAAHVPVPSIDDALLPDADPQKVALMLDQVIRDAEVPIACDASADRSSLRESRCRVIRVPAGCRSAQAMVDHLGYRSDAFDWTGPPDSIEVIVWQPSISLRDTRLFHGGEISYREERANPAAPPVETFSDAFLRTIIRANASAAPRSRRNGSGSGKSARD